MWFVGDFPGPYPLLLLAIGFTSHLAATRFGVHPHWRDVFLLVFLITALVGVTIAHDPAPAWAKFWLIVGAIGLYYALSHQTFALTRYLAYAFVGIFGVGLCGYFYLTNDWSAGATKMPWLAALSGQLMSSAPSLISHRMHPNVVGGMLAMAIPFYIPLITLLRAPSSQSISAQRALALRIVSVGWVTAFGFALVTLILTASRGAWAALAVMCGVWVLWRLVGVRLRKQNGVVNHRDWHLRLILTGGAVVVGSLGIVLFAFIILQAQLPGAAALSNRLTLLQDTLLLARDYIVTGAGLGMFEMQLSMYTLLIHVTYIVHSHNLLLNLLIEQGVFGLLSYTFLSVSAVVIALQRLRAARSGSATAIEAAVVATGVILLHGMVDDAFYGSRGLLLLFAPMGLIITAPTVNIVQSDTSGTLRARRWISAKAMVAAALCVVAVVSVIMHRPILAALYANLGAVEQSRVELGAYDEHRLERTIDIIRHEVNLDRAIGMFHQAVGFDNGNATARQRLAAIAMSKGAYTDALAHMQSAWAAGHRDSTTRMLLGDAYVANGNPALAAETVKGLPWAVSRLSLQAAFRYAAQNDHKRAAEAWSTVVLLEPNNASAAQSQREAEQRAKQQR